MGLGGVERVALACRGVSVNVAAQRAVVLDVDRAGGDVAGAHVRRRGEDRRGPAVVEDGLFEPAANVLFGFADWAVKLAPEAPVMPTATRTVARAARARRGFALRILNRDMGELLECLGADTRGSVRRWQPGYLVVVETLGFASPPRDGFAGIS